MESEKFTFFYTKESPFSQFHSAKFTAIPITFHENEEGEEPKQFLHCEQWMMYHKAKMFRDEESAKAILKETVPLACKRLGRKVKNFNQLEWEKRNLRVIYEGNKHKFTQNPELLKALMDAKGTTLAEASPRDRTYGIGMGANNPKALNRSTWRGKNLLGETLTKLREDLMKNQETKDNESQDTASGSSTSSSSKKSK